MENSKLLNILNPVLGFIDSGKFFRQPFKWLYIIIGVLNIIIPIAMIIGVSNGWDYMQGAMRFAMVLNILVAILVAFLGFLIWYKRAQNLNAMLENPRVSSLYPLWLICSRPTANGLA